MSNDQVPLYIKQSEVVAVLLADGWNDVKPGTFEILEFNIDAGPEDRDFGESYRVGVGFSFDVENDIVAGPISSLLAVKY